MASITLHTVRGYIKIVSLDADTLEYIKDNNGRYIQLTPNSSYQLEVYTDNGVFAQINTTGSLTDTTGQEVKVGFVLRSDPDYCSPGILFRIGYGKSDESQCH